MNGLRMKMGAEEDKEDPNNNKVTLMMNPSSRATKTKREEGEDNEIIFIGFKQVRERSTSSSGIGIGNDNPLPGPSPSTSCASNLQQQLTQEEANHIQIQQVQMQQTESWGENREQSICSSNAVFGKTKHSSRESISKPKPVKKSLHRQNYVISSSRHESNSDCTTIILKKCNKSIAKTKARNPIKHPKKKIQADEKAKVKKHKEKKKVLQIHELQQPPPPQQPQRKILVAKRSLGARRSVTKARVVSAKQQEEETGNVAFVSYERLMLSLQSPLPHEHEFSLSICLMMSSGKLGSSSSSSEGKGKNLIAENPVILKVLLAHLGFYSDHDTALKVSMKETQRVVFGLEFSAYWKQLCGGSDDVSFLKSLISDVDDEYESDYFWPTLSFEERNKLEQRVTLIGTILRNFSLQKYDASVMAKDTLTLKFLLVLTQINHATFPQIAFDILSNIAEFIGQESALGIGSGGRYKEYFNLSEELIKLMKTTVMTSQDRFKILRALETLQGMVRSEDDNVKFQVTFTNEDIDLFRMIFDFLTLNQDRVLAIACLECLLAFTESGTKSCEEILEIRGSITMLMSYVTGDSSSGLLFEPEENYKFESNESVIETQDLPVPTITSTASISQNQTLSQRAPSKKAVSGVIPSRPHQKNLLQPTQKGAVKTVMSRACVNHEVEAAVPPGSIKEGDKTFLMLQSNLKRMLAGIANDHTYAGKMDIISSNMRIQHFTIGKNGVTLPMSLSSLLKTSALSSSSKVVSRVNSVDGTERTRNQILVDKKFLDKSIVKVHQTKQSYSPLPESAKKLTTPSQVSNIRIPATGVSSISSSNSSSPECVPILSSRCNRNFVKGSRLLKSLSQDIIAECSRSLGQAFPSVFEEEEIEKEEDPVTKNNRLTAVLILRNLVKHSSGARKMLAVYESDLVNIAVLKNYDCSNMVARLLNDISLSVV